MIQVKNESNDWVEGNPVQGQLYRMVENGNVLLESYWSAPVVDLRQEFTISSHQIAADGQPLQPFNGNYYCESGDVIQLQGNITDENGDTVTSISVPVTLKMPLVRHANGQPTTDEIYLNVTLAAGVLTATGKIERSGDWKILIERNNEALQRIGAQWKLSAADITFLA